ncbi:hypothetical protein [Cupriavidus pauculus]
MPKTTRDLTDYQMGRTDYLAGITFAHHESDQWKAGWLAAQAECGA